MKKIIKPWGYELIVENNKKYSVKKLFMKKGKRCSLQFHKKKRETIYVLSGKLRITFGNKINKLRNKIFTSGESLTIKPNTIHRMEAVSNAYYLEASTSQLKDVVRLEDDFNRV